MEHITVLLIADAPEDARFLWEMLVKGRGRGAPALTFDVAYAERLSTGLTRLAAGGVDVILLDLMLPDSQGLETLVRLYNHAPHLPVVVRTSLDDEALAAQAVQMGAQDYVVKEHLDSAVLVHVLHYAVERHRLLMALQASERRLRNVIAGNADGIIVVDRAGVVRFVNPAAQALFGRKADAFLGTALGFSVTVGETTEVDIVGQPQPTVAEMRVVEIEWEGDFAYLASLRDITQRRSVEEALRHSEARYRALVEGTLQGIYISQHGTIRFANAALAAMFGYGRAEELVGKDDLELTAPPSHALVTQYQRAREQGEDVPPHYAFQGLRKDGALIWVEIVVTRVSWESAPASLVTVVDMTERKRMEDELLKARKIESVGVLAGGIAHDFNNLLTGIMGNVSLAKRFAGPHEKVIARLTEAENACQLATALTHQLLTFSEGGAPVRHTVSIAELLTESAGFALHGANVRGDLAIPEDLWPVDVDIGQISQVIHNVVLNAAQAMPEGGTVQVQAENVLLSMGCALPLAEGRYVKIAVHDQGCGIPQAVISNIFDPYFTTKEHGSGLGLATAYSIVTKHDGYITAASDVGVGTTLSIYLPASRHAIVPSQDTAEAPGSGSGSGRILVMDDEAAIRDLLREMLTSLGYEVECACDGAGATAVYQRATAAGEPFTAVILDNTIPGGMGGRETLERLRIIDPQVKAILSSGYANDPMMANCAQYGFSGVVAKPYTVMGLHDVLQRVIGG